MPDQPNNRDQHPGRKPKADEVVVVIPKRAAKAFNRFLREWKQARLRPKGWWRSDFLSALAKCGNVSQAADMTRIQRQEANRLARKDAEFKQQMIEAKQEFADRVEAAAITRAIDGVLVKLFHQGEPIIDPETGRQYVERQYSDKLLLRLLETKLPATYGKTVKHQHSGASDTRVAGMTPEQARREVMKRLQQLVGAAAS